MAKIRGHGEGSIYKRKDGLWVAQILAQGTKLYKYCKTQREARDWLQETRSQIQSGLKLASAQITLSQFLLQWLESHRASIRPNTFQQYSYIVNHHLLPGIGRIRLKDLRPDHIQALYNSSSEGR